MLGTTQKHRNFVAEPMGKKPVTELPGIGKVLGQQLCDRGFSQASDVLGMYLILKKNNMQFEAWLKSVCNANSKHARDTSNGLSVWCSHFL